jgi:riboflavin synthase
MFTGIVENMATLISANPDGSNINFVFQSPLSHTFKVDQSVSHNGVCLTIVAVDGDKHTVTAIHETLLKTNLGMLKLGNLVNLERCMKADGRYDGHIVQGHVDTTATCVLCKVEQGSWLFGFEFSSDDWQTLIVPKGSICINGVSLTLVLAESNYVQVAIIPYTYNHTTFAQIQLGDKVNIEFDILGKYIQRHLTRQKL